MIMAYTPVFLVIFCGYWILKSAWKVFAYVRITLKADKALQQFPADPSHWFLGHLGHHPGPNHEGIIKNNELVAKYRRYYVFRFGPLRPVLQLNYPDVIKEVIKNNQPKQSFPGGYDFFRPFMGDSIFLSTGAKWHRNHKLIAPVFYLENLKSHFAAFNKCADTGLRKIQSKFIDLNKYVYARDFCNLLVLDILLQTIFSIDENVQTGNTCAPLVEAVMDAGEKLMHRAPRPHLYFDLIYYQTTAGRLFKNHCQVIHKYASDKIKQRRLELETSKKNMNKTRNSDILDILLSAKDEDDCGMTDEEIKDEVITFLAAGIDTSASTLSLVLYNLACHPDIQLRARQEVDALLADKGRESIEWADLQHLEYVAMCIKETMRLYPVAMVLPRQTDKPLQIDGKWLPEGTLVDVNVWNLHHNPDLWEEPMKFDPDRFLPDRCKQMVPYTYMPFSMGQRSCIGKQFAMNDMKAVMARILRKFEFTIDPSYQLRLLPSTVLRAESDVPIKFIPRNDI